MAFKLQVILIEIGGNFWWKSLGKKRKDVLNKGSLIYLKTTATKLASSLKNDFNSSNNFVSVRCWPPRLAFFLP